MDSNFNMDMGPVDVDLEGLGPLDEIAREANQNELYQNEYCGNSAMGQFSEKCLDFNNNNCALKNLFDTALIMTNT